MGYTPLQKKVIDAAVKILKTRTRFRGVCLDLMPKDYEIEKDFDKAVDTLVVDSDYWNDEFYSHTEEK